VQNVSSTTPWMTLVGNHEIEPLFNTTFLSYSQRFRMPYINAGGPAAAPSLFYSYNVGPAHVVMLCTYCDYNASSPQFAWLQEDLATVDRAVTPWVFVAMHAPWYNSNYAHQGEAEPLRLVWEDTLNQYNVDMVFTGHVHGAWP
jgi:3',5'-cyclic AMP phosphodiesterase CpdA